MFFVTPHQMHRHHQDIRDQFRAFRLEMMLGHPEGVAAPLNLRSADPAGQASLADALARRP
jgi:hypothetical protein